MSGRAADNRVFHAAAMGAVIGLFASFSVRLADTPLGILIWTTCAVFFGTIALVLYEVVCGTEEPEGIVETQEPQLPLIVTRTQLRRSEKVLLEVRNIGEVAITLQPNWRDGGMLRLAKILPGDQVVVARLRVVDE